MGAEGYLPVAKAVGVISQDGGDGRHFWRSGSLVDQSIEVDGIHEVAGAVPGALREVAAVGECKTEDGLFIYRAGGNKMFEFFCSFPVGKEGQLSDGNGPVIGKVVISVCLEGI